MSKKGAAALQKDAPWRASSPGAKPTPKIHLSPVLRIPQTPYSSFALSIMKNPDPVGNGLGVDAVLESAGPDCIVPGQATPLKLLGLKEMPFHLDFFASHCGTSVSWHSSLANNIIMVAFLVLFVGRFVEKNNHLVLCGLTEKYMFLNFFLQYTQNGVLDDGCYILVWPIDIELKFLDRVGRELKMVGRVMDSAVNTMNKTFVDD